MVSAIAAYDPSYEPSAENDLHRIKSGIATEGRSETEEWRISTWFDSEIRKTTRNGTDWFEVTVSCDGQALSCGSPMLERAYAFMRLYQQIIVYQFYSVGPPWAPRDPFPQ